MEYAFLADVYEKLESVPSKLKKTEILAKFFSETPSEQLPKIALLVQGRVFPSYSEFELGIAKQMLSRAISKATGFSVGEVENKFRRTGDLGTTVEECIKSKRQSTLLKKKLTVDYVFETLQKLSSMNGKGSQERKLILIAELFASAQPKEARYIARTILQDLRVGAAEGLIRDAIIDAFLVSKDSTKDEKEKADYAVEYARNILSDFGEVARIAKEDGMEGLVKLKVEIGKPIQVMLGEKAESIMEVLDKFGKVMAEFKYDGMRAQIHKKGNDIWIFTRRLENVTKQFSDLVELCKKGIKAKECIIEGEVLGVDPKTKLPLPFQILSQRIHRKYGIEEMIKQIPVQMNLFDIVYLDGKMVIDKPLSERRKLLENVVKNIPEKFQLTSNIISGDEKELEKFYKEALVAKQEGLVLKVLDSPYVFGRHVGGWYKIKPTMESLDLVIIGGTWGEGARANWITSYVIACRDPDTGKFLECGMISTGLTEAEYDLMTETLKPLIIEEKGRTIRVEPKVVVEVKYQEIQKSPNYKSGFALRFPVLSRTREDKGPQDADTISRVKKLYESQGRAG